MKVTINAAVVQQLMATVGPSGYTKQQKLSVAAITFFKLPQTNRNFRAALDGRFTVRDLPDGGAEIEAPSSGIDF